MKKFLAVLMIFAMMTSMVFAIDEVGKIETHEEEIIGRVGVDGDTLKVQVKPEYFILDAKGHLIVGDEEFPTTKKGNKNEKATDPINPKLGKFELKYEFDFDLDDGHPPVMKEMLMKQYDDDIEIGTMIAVKVEVIRDIAFIRVHNRWAALGEFDPGYEMTLEEYLKAFYGDLIITGWLVGTQFDDERNWATYATYQIED